MSRASLASSARAVTPRGLLSFSGPGIAIVVPLVLGAALLSPYGQFLGITAVITAIVALSLGLVTGRAGMISLCQMAFAGLGAWMMLWFEVHAPGVPFLLAILLSGLAIVPVSLLVSVPALRLRGVNLAVITIAFALTVQIVLTVNGFPGESNGVVVLRPGAFVSDKSFLWLCAAIFVGFALLLALIDRTPIGASWRAVRHSERAAAALGRSVPITKLSAFALSGFIAGVAGALLVAQLAVANVETFLPLASLTAFAIAIMVAAQYPEGALLAGALGVFIPQLFNTLNIPQDYSNLLFAVGAIVGLAGGLGAAEVFRNAGRRLVSLGTAKGPVTAAGPPPLSVLATGNAAVGGPNVPLTPPEENRGNGDETGATPALALRGVSVSYGQVKALDEVSFTVPAGSVTALIGPNGAGKSTLVDCVSGFISGYGGSILVDGEPIDSLLAHARARRGARRTFQQDRTIPDLTIRQYLRLSLASSRRSARRSQEEIDDLLTFFGCPSASHRLSTIDVGARRLVEVVSAIAANPKVVLLDEPAAGLASEESAQLARAIAAVPGRYRTSVLLIEHDMDLVARAATHAVVLDFGRVIASGSPKEVLSNKAVVEAYLGDEVAV
jgi:branched-chain amino acid transport system permease protein